MNLLDHTACKSRQRSRAVAMNVIHRKRPIVLTHTACAGHFIHSAWVFN